MTLPLTIIHEDEQLVAVAKPAGQATAPGGGLAIGESLQEAVAEHIGGKALLVHRLDRETSGLIVFARDSATHRRLSQSFEARQVGKTYIALVEGHTDDLVGEVAEPLRAFGSGRVGVDPAGREAITRYAVKERLSGADLLDLTPLTGRRHQIRVHLYAIGHPVLGDTRYGEPRPVGGASRLMLHASELTIADADGTQLMLRADAPYEFQEVVDAHR